MSDPQPIEFYWQATWRCSIHKGQAAGFVVKREGEVYRRACTEKCASVQAWELQRAKEAREKVQP